MNKERLDLLFPTEHKRKMVVPIIMGIVELVRPAYTNVDKAHDFNHIYYVFKRSIKLYEANKHRLLKSSGFPADETQAILLLSLASIMHDVYSHTRRDVHHVAAYQLLDQILQLKTMTIKNKTKWLIERKEKSIMSDIPGQDGSKWDKHTFDWLQYFNTDMIKLAMDMVLEHRASNKDMFTNIWCEIFSAADRDDLNLEVIIGRIYNSKVGKNVILTMDSSKEVQIIRIINGGSKNITTTYIRKLWDEYGYDMLMTDVFMHLIDKYSKSGYMFKKLKPDGVYMSYYKEQLEDYWREIEDMIDDPSLFIPYINKLKKKDKVWKHF